MLEFDEADTIARMAANLKDRDDVWWCPLLMPGRWEVVTGKDAESFLARWIATDRANGRPPFAALYPPLKILRLPMSWAPIILWQIAVDVRFDVGVVDMIEYTPDHHRHLSSIRRVLDYNEETAPEETPIIDYLLTILPVIGRIQRGKIPPAAELGPAAVMERLGCTVGPITNANSAIECLNFALSLSRRSDGRLAVVDPACPASLAPAATTPLFDLPSLGVEAPVAAGADRQWSVNCVVWGGGGLWSLTAAVEDDELSIISIEKRADVPRRPPEAAVGIVRLFDYEMPEIVRLPKVDPPSGPAMPRVRRRPRVEGRSARALD